MTKHQWAIQTTIRSAREMCSQITFASDSPQGAVSNRVAVPGAEDSPFSSESFEHPGVGLDTPLLRKIFVCGLLLMLEGLVACTGLSSNNTSDKVTLGSLNLTSSTLSFGNVSVGASASQSVTVSNSSDRAVTVTRATISGTGFRLTGFTTPITLNPSQNITFTVGFYPLSLGSAIGALTIESNSSSPVLVLSLSGNGTASGNQAPAILVSAPSSLNFGSIPVGSSASQSVTLSNSGGTTLSISGASISGAGFQFTGLTLPLTLNPSQNTSFTVSFNPLSAGSASGALTISSDASDSVLNLSFSGTGISSGSPGQLSVTPSSFSLGNIVLGTSGTASGSLSATGNAVTVSAISVSNSAFSVGGVSLPLTLQPGQAVSFTIVFNPQWAGTASAILIVSTNSESPQVQIPIAATAIPAPYYSANLSWTASTIADVAGYNIYRAVYTNGCGPYTKINTTLVPGTSYTDGTLVDATAYCYQAAAVNTAHQEVGYSNIVANIQVPFP